jgi:transposase
MKRFRDPVLPRTQIALIPTSLEEVVDPADPVRVLDLVLDLASRLLETDPFAATYPGGGAPAYAPLMLVKVLLFALNEGLHSSRQIAQRLRYDARYLYLAHGAQPDFHTLCRFRRAQEGALRILFTAAVQLAHQLNLVTLERIACDGTKLEAVASRCEVYDAERLARHLARAEARLAALLQAAEACDAQEDADAATAPAPVTAEQLAALRARIDTLTQLTQELQESGQTYVVRTERESGVMKTTHGTRPGYNAQAAVDGDHQIVVGATVNTEPGDNHQLGSLLDAVEATTGQQAHDVLVDGGYWSPETLQDAAAAGVDLYLPVPGGETEHAAQGFHYQAETDTYTCAHGGTLTCVKTRQQRGRDYRVFRCGGAACPQAAACHGAKKPYKELWRRVNCPTVTAHAVKMATPAAQEKYRWRKQIVEPVFSHLKTVFRVERLYLAGLSGARIQVLLGCLCHNVRKIMPYFQAHTA